MIYHNSVQIDGPHTRSHLTRTEAEHKLSTMLATFEKSRKELMQRIHYAQRSVVQLHGAVKGPQERLIHALKERRKLTSDLWDVNRKTVIALTSLPACSQTPTITWASNDCRATNHGYEDIFLLLRQLHRSWSKPELTFSQVTFMRLCTVLFARCRGISYVYA